MKRFHLWCAAALLPLLAACNVNVIPPTEFTETRTFDLISPAPLGDLPFIIDVDAFSSECASRYKLVFREEANRIEIDEFNRWSMPPGAMLTKFLSARFASHSDNQQRDGKPSFELDGSVLNCELNKAKKQVDLLVHFFVVEHGDDTFRITGTESYSIPVDGTTAEAFADGMNKAAERFADHVVSVLKEELGKRANEAKAAPEKK
jgi:hypothetical protein